MQAAALWVVGIRLLSISCQLAANQYRPQQNSVMHMYMLQSIVVVAGCFAVLAGSRRTGTWRYTSGWLLLSP